MTNDDLDGRVRQALDDLLARHSTEPPPFDPTTPQHSTARSNRRARRISAILIGTLVLTVAFGGGYALGNNSDTPTWPTPLRHVHTQSSLADAAACPTQAATLSVDPTSNLSPGTRVSISGPLYHLNEEGTMVIPADQDIQAWWNIDPTQIARLTPDAIAIANGSSPTGTSMLGDDKPNGACNFTLTLHVPNVPAGTYPISVVDVGGGGLTLYGSLQVTVT